VGTVGVTTLRISVPLEKFLIECMLGISRRGSMPLDASIDYSDASALSKRADFFTLWEQK
jgi:hypothetical protein